MMEQTYGYECCFDFPREYGNQTLPTFTASGNLPLKNDLQAVCDSQHAGS